MPPPGLHVCPILVRSSNVYGAWDEVAASSPVELPLALKQLASGAGVLWHPFFGVFLVVGT
jgi:prophage DNA circulation protein